MTVVAFAGRRVDAASADTPRFPLVRVEVVSARLHEALRSLDASILVASAAAGADLLALREAGALGIERHVLLPVPPSRFVAESVADRPGEWTSLFDAVLADLRRRGTLVVLDTAGGEMGFRAATEAIIRTAQEMAAARNATAVALVAWDGQSRGPDDLTAMFRDGAASAGLAVHEIDTLRP